MNISLDTLSLVLAGLLGAVVSGNNISACCGTIIGSRMVSRRSGILIAVAGYLLGLSIEGPELFRVRQAFLPNETSTEIFSILLATLLIFIGGELARVPLSLSKALTGTILGVSIAIGTLQQTNYLILILIFWVSAPIVATALGLFFVRLDDRYSTRNLWVKLSLLKAGLVVMAFLSAYVTGSNALGLIAGVPSNQPLIATIAVGIGSVLGASVLGRGALRRLTEGIYSLRYPNAFYSQLLGAGTVELANQLGIPLSTTETVSSGIIGSGLASKMRVMNSRNVFLIIASWVISPALGFLLGYGLTLLFG
ncbi:MAG TPA: inorganic phosphate transporter [Candidatus Bathyarchaeia archaeon]|nr:inorganic phosphate transporter [Candidatus Bathyarchaeia archaeon]